MVGVDVGDHRNQRLQVQEAGIALVSFSNQVTAGAQLGIGACCIQTATDDERRVQATGCEHRSQQAGGGGFTVRTGNGDAVAIAHQLSQHFSPWHHWNAALKRTGDFRVGGVYSAGHHQYIGVGSVLGAVADKDVRAKRLKAFGDRRCIEVRARHLVAQVQQYLSDPAHAHAADTDEVDTTDAAHFRLRHGFLILNHWPPPGRCRQRYGWHQVWPGDARWPPCC